MKLFFALLFVLISLPLFACSPITYFQELEELGTYLITHSSSPSHQTRTIRNCRLLPGEEILMNHLYQRQLISEFPEQRSKIETIKFTSNFSCEFLMDGLRQYERRAFMGKLVYTESIMSAPGTSCENQPYSYTLTFSLKGYKDGLWKIQDIKNELTLVKK